MSRPDDMEDALLRDFEAETAEVQRLQRIVDEIATDGLAHSLDDQRKAAEADAARLRAEVLSLKSEVAEMVPIGECIPQEHYDELAAERDALARRVASCKRILESMNQGEGSFWSVQEDLRKALAPGTETLPEAQGREEEAK